MAQVFPLNVDDLSQDEARTSLAATLVALPDPWTLLRDRRIGEEMAEPIEVVLVHPEIGVALVEEAPRDAAPAAHQLRRYLDEQRFSEFFAGELPIVAVSVARDQFDTIGEQLAGAFEAAPRLSIDDADWADAVIELLMVPDDLAMAPVSEVEPAAVPPADEAFEGSSRDRSHGFAGEQVELHLREQFDRAPGDRRGEAPLELRTPVPAPDREATLPLMVDWPFGESYQRKRRRGRTAAVAVVLLLLAGAGVAAWDYAGGDLTLAVNDFRSRDQVPATGDTAPVARDAAPSSQIEMPLPQRSSGDEAAAAPARSMPPPVPAAPPVVMAQKPYAPPPPTPPKPTAIEPLPQVVVMAQKPYASAPPEPPKPTPVTPLPQVAAAAPAPLPAPAPASPPAETAGVSPPAKPAQSAATQKPTQTAKAEARPRPVAPVHHQAASSHARPGEETLNPPIDAADLPPLDEEPAPQEPRESRLAGPAASGAPSARAPLGPPVPLWRAQASNAPPPAATPAAAAEPANRECRPYTSSTTLTGRGLRVEGIACRGNDGQWRLVSEVPLR